MRKISFVSGTVAGSLTVLGGLFKIMHWPGANIMLVLGLERLLSFLFQLQLSIGTIKIWLNQFKISLKQIICKLSVFASATILKTLVNTIFYNYKIEIDANFNV